MTNKYQPKPGQLCTACQQLLVERGWYDDNRGRCVRTWCRPCTTAVNRATKRRTLQQRKEYNAKWNAEHRERRREYYREYVARHPEREYQRRLAWRLANQDKLRTHQAVARAIARGELVRPDECESCHAVGPVQGHHTDYSKPLEVQWLCLSCHARANVANVDWDARFGRSGDRHQWGGPL